MSSVSYPKAVLESTRPVVQAGRWVSINQDAPHSMARQWATAGLRVPEWDRTYHYSGPQDLTANYILVLDSVNFCFWGETRWEIEYHGQKLSGYWALAASLKRAVEEGVPVLDAHYLASIQEHEVAYIFRGAGQIPLLSERARILRDVGSALGDKYSGKLSNLLHAAGYSAPGVVELAVRDLPYFDDEACYHDERVFFYKRAQIMAADLWGAFGGAGLGALSGMDQLTTFADYKLPQVLREMGILEYSAELAAEVDSMTLIDPGSEKEVEIRACTIWAVEEIKEALRDQGVDIPSFQLDWRLWELGQTMELSRPYHRTRTIYY